MAGRQFGSSRYWDHVVETFSTRPPLNVWRQYMNEVYSGLILHWFPTNSGNSFKTDLFEEAVSQHSPLLQMGAGTIGFDHSLGMAQAAQQRLAKNGHPLVVGDLRRLPLRTESFQRILSGSSLDHFLIKSDIKVSLQEVARVLALGGVLVLTLDNPHNPIVWLRNHLPFRFLNRLGIVPYYIGPTYYLEETEKQLANLGFTVTHKTAVAHVPRAPFIWLISILERLHLSRWDSLLLNFLIAFERLERRRLRYRTGYYLAFRAVKGHVGAQV